MEVETGPVPDAHGDESLDRMRKELQLQLDDLQIETVWTLVESIPTRRYQSNCLCSHRTSDYSGCSAGPKKLLFLKNSQVDRMEFSNLDNFMFAFGLNPPPKLVVQFHNCSVCVHRRQECPAYYCHWDVLDLSNDFGMSYHCGGNSYADVVEQDKRISKLVLEVLLPLCIETNALVLLALDSCALSRAFSEHSLTERARRGGYLPFHVMEVCKASDYCMQLAQKDSYEYELMSNSTRWSSELSTNQRFRAQLARVKDPRTLTSSMWDFSLHRGATHYVVCDGNPSNWMTRFAQSLSSSMPCVSIATLSAPTCYDAVRRGVPTLFLDSTERAAVESLTSLDNLKEFMISRERALSMNGQTSCHLASDVALMRQIVDQVVMRQTADIKCCEATDAQGSHGAQYIHEAVQLREKSVNENLHDGNQQQETAVKFIEWYEEFTAAKRRRCVELDQARLACLADEFEGFTDLSTVRERLKIVSVALQLESKQECMETLEQSLGAAVVRRVATKVFQKRTNAPLYFIEYLHLVDTHSLSLAVIKACIGATLRAFSARDDLVTVHDHYGDIWHPDSYNEWMAFLTNERVIAGNLENVSQARRKLLQIAKLDRLPDENTYESLVVLRDCWNKVDMFNRSADTCKIGSKSAFLLLIFLTAATTIVIVIDLNLDVFGDELVPELVVGGLSLFTSITASAIALLNPQTRWTQLRSAAVALESEIWKFRTRSCEYAQDLGRLDDREAEHRLRDVCDEIADQVFRSGCNC